MKKMLSIILALSMLLTFCILSPVVGAEETTNPDLGPIVYLNTTYTDEILEAYDNSNVFDFSEEEKNAMILNQAEHYENSTLKGPPTKKYNCHSYAWHLQDSSNTYWIDDSAELLKYIADYSYFEIINPDPEDLQPGDIVVYIHSQGAPSEEDDYWLHSAVVKSVLGDCEPGTTTIASIIVKSKWGKGGLYEHNGYECSYTEYAEEADAENYNPNEVADYYRYFRQHDHNICVSTIPMNDPMHATKHVNHCENEEECKAEAIYVSHDWTYESLAESNSDYLSKHIKKCDHDEGGCGYQIYESHTWEMSYIHAEPGAAEIQARPRYTCSECGVMSLLPPPGYMNIPEDHEVE